MSEQVGKFKVGQKWKRGDGKVVSLAAIHPTGTAFSDTDCLWYDEGGFYMNGPTHCGVRVGEHPRDLVELIEDVQPAKPASTQFTVGMEGVRTRDGRKVRILCVDAHADKHIVGLIEHSHGGEYLHCWLANGSSNGSSQPENHDLIPPKRYAWLNVYVDGQTVHNTKETANAYAHERRVGCVKVPMEARFDE